jgi:hypothetical protein
MAASWISFRLFAALCLSQFRPKSGRTGNYSIALMRLDERRKKFNSHAGGSPAEVTFIQEIFAAGVVPTISGTGLDPVAVRRRIRVGGNCCRAYDIVESGGASIVELREDAAKERNGVVRKDLFAVRNTKETSCPVSDSVYNTRDVCPCSECRHLSI